MVIQGPRKADKFFCIYYCGIYAEDWSIIIITLDPQSLQICQKEFPQ